MTPTEFDAFRKNVIKVARAAAKEYDWCDVVDTLRKAGFGDLLPPVYVIQQQKSSRSNWKDDEDYEPWPSLKEATAEVKTLRVGGYNHSRSTYVGRNITTLEDIRWVRGQLAAAEAKLKGSAVPEWPKYRLVKRTNADEVLDV